MEKAPDAFRTISEVAEELDLPQHVLRFWETRFAQIKPLKRGGGRRYYRPDDVDLLKGIRHLLYGEGYTIRGVQRLIKDNGVKAMIEIGRSVAHVPVQKPQGPDIVLPAPPGQEASITPPRVRDRAEPMQLPFGPFEDEEAVTDPPPPPSNGHSFYGGPMPEIPPSPPQPLAYPQRIHTPPQPAAPRPQASPPPPEPAPPPVAMPPPVQPPAAPLPATMDADDIRRLQATMLDLMDARRLLDDSLKR